MLFSLISGQNSNQDSLKLKSPSVAALRAFTFPGGGQFYNNQPIKGSLLTSAGIASVYLYYDHSNKYNNSSSLSSVDKKIISIKETGMDGGSSLSIFMACWMLLWKHICIHLIQ